MVCLSYGLTKMTIDLIRDPMISASATLALLASLLILLIGMLGDAVATRLGRLTNNIVGVRTATYIEEHPPEREHSVAR
jgi:hypothetical protein